MDKPHNYEVGYARPPKSTQYPKGVSGNPKGRPKGSDNLNEVMRKVGATMFTLTDGGMPKRMSANEAMMRKLQRMGMCGDLGAMRLYLLYSIKAEEDLATQKPPTVRTDSDKELSERFLKRVAQNIQSSHQSESVDSEERFINVIY